MENKKDNKFSIVSRIYSKNFKTVTFVILNSETGELRKEVINNHIENKEELNKVNPGFDIENNKEIINGMSINDMGKKISELFISNTK